MHYKAQVSMNYNPQTHNNVQQFVDAHSFKGVIIFVTYRLSNEIKQLRSIMLIKKAKFWSINLTIDLMQI